ncbi:MAG: hypothetical protein ACYS29_08435 [Planctomycetota bacterium]|jgi:hypothetical protein
MKPAYKKLIKVIVIVLVVPLFLNAVCTWGIIFDYEGGFEDSGTWILEDIYTGGFVTMTVGEDINIRLFAIPLVLYVYGIEPPPYVISLRIGDNTETYEKILIESVSIEYDDGQKINQNINWEGVFERVKTPFDNMESFKPSDLPNTYMFGKLPLTVNRRQSCNIRLVGGFINRDGDKIPFDITEHFEYKPHVLKKDTNIASIAR